MSGEPEKIDIAYCGLCCNDCTSHKGEIADLARDLRKKLREEKFDRAAPGMAKYFKELEDYEKCYATLGAMVRLRCGKKCHDGGGNPGCKIRKCCVKKGIPGCWECDETGADVCDKHAFLKPIHGEENVENIRKIKKIGLEDYCARKSK